MENQIEKKMEHEMETRIMMGYTGVIFLVTLGTSTS